MQRNGWNINIWYYNCWRLSNKACKKDWLRNWHWLAVNRKEKLKRIHTSRIKEILSYKEKIMQNIKSHM